MTHPLIQQARRVEGYEDTPRWYIIWRFHDNLMLRTRAECIICGEYIAEVAHDRYHLDMPHPVKADFFGQIAVHAATHKRDATTETTPTTEAGGGHSTPTSIGEEMKPPAQRPSVAFAEVGVAAAEGLKSGLPWHECVRCGARQQSLTVPVICLSPAKGGCGRSDTEFKVVSQ